MFKMGVGHSDELNIDACVAEVLAQTAAALDGEKPQGGLLFAAIDMDHERLLAGINQAYPAIQLIGCTTDGEVSSVMGFQEDSVTLAVFASDVVEITAGVGRHACQDAVAACQEAVAQARAKSTQEPVMCITTPDGLTFNVADAVRGLQAALGEQVIVLGGAAGDQREFKATYQFCRDEVHQDAVPVLLFSGPLVYSAGVASGWKPLGESAQITKSEGKVVHEIDGKPAIDFYHHYFGRNVGGSKGTPLAVFEKDGDGYYLRAFFFHDEDAGTVTFAGEVPEGATVQLTDASREGLLEGTADSLRQALDAYRGDSAPEAALFFCCAGRKAILGTRTGEELDIIRSRVDVNLPLYGFYCYGEIGPVGQSHESRFHNQTFVSVMLGTR